MSYVKVWIHLVFTTKNRNDLLTGDIRPEVFEHIRIHGAAKGIFLKAIGGYVEHVHCLLSLGRTQTVADVAQLIKGESSFWINKHRFCRSRFSWQDDYYAVSVSESLVKRVTAYIDNQERHHADKTWEDEENELMDKYGFQRVEGLTEVNENRGELG